MSTEQRGAVRRVPGGPGSGWQPAAPLGGRLQGQDPLGTAPPPAARRRSLRFRITASRYPLPGLWGERGSPGSRRISESWSPPTLVALGAGQLLSNDQVHGASAPASSSIPSSRWRLPSDRGTRTGPYRSAAGPHLSGSELPRVYPMRAPQPRRVRASGEQSRAENYPETQLMKSCPGLPDSDKQWRVTARRLENPTSLLHQNSSRGIKKLNRK